MILSLGLLLAPVSSAGISPKTKRQVVKAHKLFKQGHVRKARKVGRRIRKGRVPLTRHNKTRCADLPGKRCKVAPSKQGCATASGEAVYDIDVLGFDTFKPSLSQQFCWKNGRITSLGGIAVDDGITAFGGIINFDSDGVIYSDARWARLGDRRHGQRILVRVIRITGCTSVPGIGGCIFPKSYDVAMALVMRGDGIWAFSGGGE